MKFYSELMRYYEYVFPLAPLKVAWLKNFIEANRVSSLLDVGCATGDLCKVMTYAVSKVNGFDLDQAMIQKAKGQYPECESIFSEGNMLDMSGLFSGEAYDLITCFGNTMVHLPTSELLKALLQIKDKLKSDGCFIGQVINYDYVFEASIRELPLIDNPTIRFDRSYDWEVESELSFKTKLTVKATGDEYDNEIKLYPIRRNALIALLQEAGFDDITFYKDYKGNLAEGKHLPLIFTAKA